MAKTQICFLFFLSSGLTFWMPDLTPKNKLLHFHNYAFCVCVRNFASAQFPSVKLLPTRPHGTAGLCFESLFMFRFYNPAHMCLRLRGK